MSITSTIVAFTGNCFSLNRAANEFLIIALNNSNGSKADSSNADGNNADDNNADLSDADLSNADGSNADSAGAR